MIEIIAVKNVFLIGFSILILNWVWRAVNWVWLRPKRLEKYLKKQGFSGNSYRILMGDMRERVIRWIKLLSHFLFLSLLILSLA
uniref:Uncharacterized protein n=1 Tax=Brassica oleracea var. oleracea TaxID=109376 RepID=A0A0D3DWW4_BRAOL